MMNDVTNDDFSSIKKIEKVVYLALPLSFVSNEKAGVIEVLDSWIRQYNQQLEAILVSYDNVSLLSRRNSVVSDKICLQVQVKANFHLFCPKVGDIAKGKINRISKELIGCLMHDTINVFIRLSDCCAEDFSKYIRLEQEILFEISHFNVHRKEVRVQGKITDHCLNLMTELFPVVEEDYLTNLSFSNQNTITQYDFFDDIDCKVPETLNVTQVNNVTSISNGVTDSSLTDDVTSANVNQEKKTKKRKRDSTLETSDTVIPSAKKSKLKQDLSINLSENIQQSSDVTDIDSDFKFDFEKDNSDLSNCAQPTDESLTISQESSDNKTSSKKKKKDKKNNTDKKNKKEKLKFKKNKIVASGSVLKTDKKNKKKKHSKKAKMEKKHSKKDKIEKKHKKDAKEKKLKHKADTLNGIKFKSED